MATYFLIFLITIISVVNGIPVNNEKGASIAIEQVQFQLYTRENGDSGHRLVVGNETSLESSGFNPNIPTKIFVHGYMDDLRSSSFQRPKKAFLELEPMNVIGVGWDACSRIVMYDQVAGCARQVGGYVGQLVQWLVDRTGLRPQDVHGIGHSLGGQAISFTSTVIKIGRISALDPAGPLFTHQGPEARIDPTDADFVDVTHTSTNFLGITPNVGHVDFYPNGGAVQPDCTGIFGGCSHSAAYHYFAHTVSLSGRNDYLGVRCDSVQEARNQSCVGVPEAPMGYGANSQHLGIFYLKTDNVPYPQELIHQQIL